MLIQLAVSAGALIAVLGGAALLLLLLRQAKDKPVTPVAVRPDKPKTARPGQVHLPRAPARRPLAADGRSGPEAGRSPMGAPAPAKPKGRAGLAPDRRR